MSDVIDIIIEVRGGNVVEVYGRSQKTRVTIVDWDNREAGDTSISAYTLNCLPVSKMPEETMNIIEASKTKTVD
jgi:hypothetical protein